MNPIAFWHESIGKHIGDLDVNLSCSTYVPQQTKKGIQNLRIGSTDSFYIASTCKSFLIGRNKLKNTLSLDFVPSEFNSPKKFLATWLIEKASSPFIVGFIGKANPSSSMRLTHHITKCYFCEADKGFEFNLEKVRRALEVIKDFSWKKEIAPAIHLHSNWMHAEDNERAKLQIKLNAMLVKIPALRTILSTIDIRPNSGEYQILSWYNIESDSYSKDPE